jgi:hypothetical protein
MLIDDEGWTMARNRNTPARRRSTAQFRGRHISRKGLKPDYAVTHFLRRRFLRGTILKLA